MSDPYARRVGFDGPGLFDLSRGGPEMSTPSVPRIADLSEADISRLTPSLQKKIRDSNRTIFKSPWFWGVVAVLVTVLVVVLMPKNENMAWGRAPNHRQLQPSIKTNIQAQRRPYGREFATPPTGNLDNADFVTKWGAGVQGAHGLGNGIGGGPAAYGTGPAVRGPFGGGPQNPRNLMSTHLTEKSKERV